MTKNNISKLIVNIYRPPNQSLESFILQFRRQLSLLGKQKEELVILGDMNIDLMEKNESRKSRLYREEIEKANLFQVISQPTRITSHCKTLIDHVLLKEIHRIESGTVITCVSDHLATFVSIG